MAEQAAVPELTLAQHRDRARDAVEVAVVAVRLGSWAVEIGDVPEVRALHALAPDAQRSVVIELLARAVGQVPDRPLVTTGDGFIHHAAVTRIYATFARRAIPYTRGDAEILLELAVTAVRAARRNGVDWLALELIGQPIAAVERAIRTDGVGDLRLSIVEAAELVGRLDRYDRTRAERFRGRLMALVGTEGEPLDPDTFDDGDSWGVAWRERVAEIEPDLRPLVVHLPLISGPAPTRQWRERASELVATQGAPDWLRAFLSDVDGARLREVPPDWAYLFDDPAKLPVPSLRDRNVLLVRGAIWAAAIGGAGWVPERLGELGVAFGTSGRSDNVARDQRIANTCAAALGTLDTDAAFAALGRMKAEVTNRNVGKQIAKAIEEAAGRRGIGASELIEMAIPTMGLDESGRREEPLGDEVAVLAVGADGEASLAWRGSDGNERSAPAKATAAAHPAEVRRLKGGLKELRSALSIERDRIEDLLVEDLAWDLETWDRRYGRHPVMAAPGRRLIWWLDDGSGPMPRSVIWSASGFVAADGSEVAAGAGTRLRLWHPIGSSDGDITAWRVAVIARQLRQPFKQAFREVYRASSDDEASAVSSRFAGRVLLYAQARALMLARRWATGFLGPFDGGDSGTAKREFPSHGVRAEFDHEAVWGPLRYQGDVTRCRTGDIRFVRIADGEALAIRDVPAIVYSEALRDVDLFVSVSAIGSDRNRPAGDVAEVPTDDADAAGDDGPLGAVARMRRDAIARLLPGLAIADRCELGERWLTVRGDLRTYRIHLGTGNAVMEPGDMPLRLVPKPERGPVGRVFLPFQDDPFLSLILAEAFLLADDTAIADRAIATRIRGQGV